MFFNLLNTMNHSFEFIAIYIHILHQDFQKIPKLKYALLQFQYNYYFWNNVKKSVCFNYDIYFIYFNYLSDKLKAA